MTIHSEELRKYADGLPYDEKKLVSTIDDIYNVVVGRYYRDYDKYPQYAEDLRNKSHMKVYDLLKQAHIKKGVNLVNTVFSGIRNEIGNFLKRKSIAVENMVANFVDGEEGAGFTGARSFDINEVFKFQQEITIKNFTMVGVTVKRIDNIIDAVKSMCESTGFQKTFMILTLRKVYLECLM